MRDGDVNSEERVVNTRTKKKGVKGYTKSMLKKFLKEKLAPKIKRMKEKDVVIGLDKGLHMKKEEVRVERRWREKYARCMDIPYEYSEVCESIR